MTLPKRLWRSFLYTCLFSVLIYSRSSFFLLKGLFCIGTYQHNGRNSCNNIQIAEHIRFQLLICIFTVDICIYHELFTWICWSIRLIITLIYRLVISPDKITVEIHIQIIQILYIRKRFKKQIDCLHKMYASAVPDCIHEGVLYDRSWSASEDIYLRHVFHFFPSKYSVLRQAFAVLHDFLTGCPLFLIYKITDQKVNCLWTSEQFI